MLCDQCEISESYLLGDVHLPAVTLAASSSFARAADGTSVRSAALWRNSVKKRTKLSFISSQTRKVRIHVKLRLETKVHILMTHDKGLTSQLKVYLGMYLQIKTGIGLNPCGVASTLCNSRRWYEKNLLIQRNFVW